MLNYYFKKTMDDLKIKGKTLSEAFGRGTGYISDIRNGKCNPPIDRFWELIDAMEALKPGAKEYFASLIAKDCRSDKELENFDPDKIIDLIDEEQLSQLMFAVAKKLGARAKTKQQKKANKNEDLLLAS